MPKIRSCNDIDLVKKDQYVVPPTRKAKQAPPEPWELPDFEIEDWDYPGEPNLPPNIDLSSPFDVWSLFFSDELMDKILKWTNTFVARNPTPPEKQPQNKARNWTPTDKPELYAYFATLIHVGGRRKPLADLSINTTHKPRDSQEWERPKRAPRTLYGCSVCKIPLCVKPGCWESHMERLRRRG